MAVWVCVLRGEQGHDTWEPVDQLQGSHVKALINGFNEKLRGTASAKAAAPVSGRVAAKRPATAPAASSAPAAKRAVPVSRKSAAGPVGAAQPSKSKKK